MSPGTASDDTVMEEIKDISASFMKGKGKGKEKASEGEKVEAESDLLPWVEKYRPATLEDLVSHKDITSTIEKFIEKSRLPHLLFYGPPGTGKTSTILAMARKIYGPNYKNNVLEVCRRNWLEGESMCVDVLPFLNQLNASDDRGIDVVREQIKSFASTKNVFSNSGGFKLIVLDEADAMTTAAQGALRRGEMLLRCCRGVCRMMAKSELSIQISTHCSH
jgi:replication factor C subunit 3/5